MTQFVQCKLISETNSIQTAWIAERGAKTGAVVDIDGDLLRVVEVYHQNRLDEAVLKHKQDLDRNSLGSIKNAKKRK